MSSDSDSDAGDVLGAVAADEEFDDWDAEDGGGGDGGDDDAEDDATRSLFGPELLPSPEAALAHDAKAHGFDLRSFRDQLRLDDYDTIRVINYVRGEVAAGRDPRPALAAAAAAAAAGSGGGGGSTAPWAGDTFLAPALPDDPLLTYDYDDDGDDAEAGGGGGGAVAAAGIAGVSLNGGGDDVAALRAAAARLAAENAELQLRVAALMDAALPADVRDALRGERAGAAAGPSSSSAAAAASPSSPSPSSSAAAAAAAGGDIASISASAAAAAAKQRVDAAYYDSYASLDIHHDMLADRPRTRAYEAALTRNPQLLRGAAVLDVGCGTGILSMFAAKGGAAEVVGLDGSARIAALARKIVAANSSKLLSGGGGAAAAAAAAGAAGAGADGSSGNGGGAGGDTPGPVRIVAGRVEAAPAAVRSNKNGADGRFDVVVSEWMGYALLFESMLDSLLAARDRWLKPGGAVLPDIARVYAAGADALALSSPFWEDSIYGFDMTPVADELAAAAAREGEVLVKPVEPAALVTAAAKVVAFDLATMARGDQDFSAAFTLTVSRDDGGGGAGGGDQQQGAAAAAAAGPGAAAAGAAADMVTLAAVVVWFDVEFSARFCPERPVTLPTGPRDPPTHWAQAVLPLAAPARLRRGAEVRCRLSMARSRATHRCLDISLELAWDGGGRSVRAYSMEVVAAAAPAGAAAEGAAAGGGGGGGAVNN